MSETILPSGSFRMNFRQTTWLLLALHTTVTVVGHGLHLLPGLNHHHCGCGHHHCEAQAPTDSPKAGLTLAAARPTAGPCSICHYLASAQSPLQQEPTLVGLSAQPLLASEFTSASLPAEYRPPSRAPPV